MADSGSRSSIGKRLANGRIARVYELPKPGARYGRWTVLDSTRSGIRCQCACGQVAEVHVSNLRSGKSTRCRQCARKKAAETRCVWSRVFAKRTDRRRWQNRIAAAIARCTDPQNAQWKNYGGRGITVHPAWVEDRLAFASYIKGLPGWDDRSLELDRIDSERGYEPGNLRMATRSQQARNTRSYRGGRDLASCGDCGEEFRKKKPSSRYCSKRCAGRASHKKNVRPS